MIYGSPFRNLLSILCLTLFPTADLDDADCGDSAPWASWLPDIQCKEGSVCRIEKEILNHYAPVLSLLFICVPVINACATVMISANHLYCSLGTCRHIYQITAFLEVCFQNVIVVLI